MGDFQEYCELKNTVPKLTNKNSLLKIELNHTDENLEIYKTDAIEFVRQLVTYKREIENLKLDNKKLEEQKELMENEWKSRTSPPDIKDDNLSDQSISEELNKKISNTPPTKDSRTTKNSHIDDKYEVKIKNFIQQIEKLKRINSDLHQKNTELQRLKKEEIIKIKKLEIGKTNLTQENRNIVNKQIIAYENINKEKEKKNRVSIANIYESVKKKFTGDGKKEKIKEHLIVNDELIKNEH